ncbi:MAG: hypothetical protein R2932_54130 [Caldilineaceae bacterium]
MARSTIAVSLRETTDWEVTCTVKDIQLFSLSLGKVPNDALVDYSDNT